MGGEICSATQYQSDLEWWSGYTLQCQYDTHQVYTSQTSSSYFENIQMTPIINFLYLESTKEHAVYKYKSAVIYSDNFTPSRGCQSWTIFPDDTIFTPKLWKVSNVMQKARVWWRGELIPALVWTWDTASNLCGTISIIFNKFNIQKIYNEIIKWV